MAREDGRCSAARPLAIGVALLVVACSSPDPAQITTGVLCSALPAGTDPGAPVLIQTDPPAVALTWIPVLTTFEAAVRAAGMTEELDGTTVLAPSNDAFDAVLSEATLDDLFLHRTEELRDLLEAHVVEGAHTQVQLLAAGDVTARSGDTFNVTDAEGMARIGPATAVCADYRANGARIHVIDAVLGDLPTPAPDDEPGVG